MNGIFNKIIRFSCKLSSYYIPLQNKVFLLTRRVLGVAVARLVL